MRPLLKTGKNCFPGIFSKINKILPFSPQNRWGRGALIDGYKWLVLRPQLLDGIKTDKELILRVEQFAKELCEFDKDNELRL